VHEQSLHVTLRRKDGWEYARLVRTPTHSLALKFARNSLTTSTNTVGFYALTNTVSDPSGHTDPKQLHWVLRTH
jgi:hypothetical protein